MLKPMAKSSLFVPYVAEGNPTSAKRVSGAIRDVNLKLNAVVGWVGRVSSEIEGCKSGASV